MARKKNQEGCDLNMTPMIDVVFQLIIFFIVTINIADTKDETVRLELGTHGAEIEAGSDKPSSLVIDVAQNGRCSIGNVTLTEARLRQVMQQRYARFGSSFAVCVRGDARARHGAIRKVMDVCTASGIGRVSFIAVKDARTPEQKDFLAKHARSRR